MASKFIMSNRTGWLMAGPAAFLIFLFVVVPFFFAITAYDNQGIESEPSDKVTFIPP